MKDYTKYDLNRKNYRNRKAHPKSALMQTRISKTEIFLTGIVDMTIILILFVGVGIAVVRGIGYDAPSFSIILIFLDIVIVVLYFVLLIVFGKPLSFMMFGYSYVSLSSFEITKRNYLQPGYNHFDSEQLARSYFPLISFLTDNTGQDYTMHIHGLVAVKNSEYRKFYEDYFVEGEIFYDFQDKNDQRFSNTQIFKD